MVSRIAPYTAYSPCKQNQTSPAYKAMPQDSVAFKCNPFSKTLNPYILDTVNAVLERMGGMALEDEVVIAGEKFHCVARISELARQTNLCLDLDGATRYVIGLIHEYKVDPSTQIRLESLRKGDFNRTEIPLDTKPAYNTAVEIVESILNSLKPKTEETALQAAS